MCKEMYVEAKSLECRYLSSETPCGLFVVSNYGSEPSSFLIVGAKNRYAVMLGDHADHSFRVMKLEEHTRNWQGCHVGPVEFMLDMTSQNVTNNRLAPGFLTFSNSGIVMKLRGEYSPHMGTEILVAECHVDEGLNGQIFFSRWSLFKRDNFGKKEILYSFDANSENA